MHGCFIRDIYVIQETLRYAWPRLLPERNKLPREPYQKWGTCELAQAAVEGPRQRPWRAKAPHTSLEQYTNKRAAAACSTFDYAYVHAPSLPSGCIDIFAKTPCPVSATIFPAATYRQPLTGSMSELGKRQEEVLHFFPRT
jgi:hypothetical protein